MKPNIMVGAILVFSITLAAIIPQLKTIVYSNDEISITKNNEASANSKAVSKVIETIDSISDVDVAIATPALEEPKPETKQEVVVTQPIVYDGMTMNELIIKLNKSLKSTLSGTGKSFAEYSINNKVDPYVAVAIVLHETGCSWDCSYQVKQCNNVGGMKSGGTAKCNKKAYAHFDSLDSGIRAFINNLKINYYDKGLNTPELMNKKYATSSAWAGKINYYINKIKNA